MCVRNVSNRSLQRSRAGASIVWLLLMLSGFGALAGGGVYVYIDQQGDQDASADSALTHTVRRERFVHDVKSPGAVESASNIDIRCEVKSRNTSGTQILEVIAEGTRVSKGDVLVRLDSSALESSEKQQKTICNNKKALEVQAKNVYETSLISKNEYLEGIYKQEEQVFQGQIFVAEETLSRAQEYYQYSQRLAAKGYVTSLQLEADRFAVEKSQNELNTARTKLHVLQKFTKAKKLKQFDADIVISKTKWDSDTATYENEYEKLQEIQAEIEKCTVRAPQAGQVVHANRRSRRSSSEIIIEPGTMVRQNQVLIRLPDSSKMQVKAKVNESQIRLFSKGLKATIRLDAFPDQELHGQIERVNEYPEPTGWGSGSVKDYAVFIRIENPTADLRPGLTAKVAVLISAEDNVLTVPVDAVKEHGGRFYCLVRPEGEWESREVKIGATNDVFVVIREGLSVGDEVVRAASRYVDRVKLPDLPKKSGKPGSARPGKGSEQRGKRRKATSQRAPRGGH